MPSPSLDEIITEIEHWFADTMRNSVVARDVAVYNHVHAAYEELKSRIAAILSSEPAAQPAPAEEEGASASKSKPAA